MAIVLATKSSKIKFCEHPLSITKTSPVIHDQLVDRLLKKPAMVLVL